MIDEATELSRVLSLPIPQVNPDPFFFLFPFAFSFNRLESHSREGKGTTQGGEPLFLSQKGVRARGPDAASLPEAP